MLIGWLFMMPVAGAALGAAGGALGGSLVDVGINDQDMKRQANEALKPGAAGLFLLIRKMTTDKVLEDLKGVGGTVIKTWFDHTKEEALKEALKPRSPAAGRAGQDLRDVRKASVERTPDARLSPSARNVRTREALAKKRDR